jgi:nucleolar protein 56
MGHYVYTSLNGVFLFNQNFKLIDKVLFKKNEIFKVNQTLKKGEWLKTELDFLKRHKNAKFLGFKDIHQHYCEWDPDKVARVETSLELYDCNLKLTKEEIKASVTDDLLAIQAISNLEETKKAINLLSKRLREWYEYYYPELSKRITDNDKFASLVLTEKPQTEMGAALDKTNLGAIMNLAKQIEDLIAFKEKQNLYLENLMKKTCSNLYALTGSLIGAKLIMHAGSLRKLSLFPSSTIQLLGAEKALFRHLKSGSRCPKYGVLLQHPLVSQAQEKGKVARMIANKIAIAVKCDINGTKGFGDKERIKLDKQFKK